MVDEFDGVFRYFQKTRKPLKLLNGYKGLPIVSEVQVLHADDSSIIVKPESRQLVCLQIQQKTFIQDPIFPRPIEARVEKIDLLSGEVALGGFSYSRAGIGDRRHLRVSPEETVPSILTRTGFRESIDGSLLDLSREGLAVRILKPYPPAFIQIGAQVIVQIHLPVSPEIRDHLDKEQQVEDRSQDTQPVGPDAPTKPIDTVSASHPLWVEGVVVNLRPEDEHAERIGIHLAQRHAANEIMLRFISYRQAQIIQELRRIYTEMVQEETLKRRQGI